MQNVIENFKNLCKIPHCSYQTEQMKEFLSSYAKEIFTLLKEILKFASKVIMIWFAWEKLQK